LTDLQGSSSAEAGTNFGSFFVVVDAQLLCAHVSCGLIEACESCIGARLRNHGLGEVAANALNICEVLKVAIMRLKGIREDDMVL
jgi:hypothetical protein